MLNKKAQLHQRTFAGAVVLSYFIRASTFLKMKKHLQSGFHFGILLFVAFEDMVVQAF